MSKAKAAGVSYEDAASAFVCNPETMRKHYIARDKMALTDRVMDEIQGRNGEKSGEIRRRCPSRTSERTHGRSP